MNALSVPNHKSKIHMIFSEKASGFLKIAITIILSIGFWGIKDMNAQETILLEGQVLNDSIDSAYLHVINLSQQRGTITNEGGKFTIPVRISDTLYISAVQLEHKKIVITPEIFSRKHISFSLNEIVNDLPEVNISNLGLSGRLGEDTKKQPVQKPFDPGAAGLPVYTGPVLTQEERRLFTATGGPVGMLLGAITGQTKMLKKLVKISNMERRVQEARNYFADSMYVRQFDIPPQLIDDFVHYIYQDNEETLNLIEQNHPLTLIGILTKKSKEYKEMKAAENGE